MRINRLIGDLSWPELPIHIAHVEALRKRSETFKHIFSDIFIDPITFINCLLIPTINPATAISSPLILVQFEENLHLWKIALIEQISLI